jgi:hypothetical protein
MGDAVGSVGGAIANAIEGLFDMIGGLLRGAFGAASGGLGLPILFIIVFVGLGFLAWFLAKR